VVGWFRGMLRVTDVGAVAVWRSHLLTPFARPADDRSTVRGAGVCGTTRFAEGPIQMAPSVGHLQPSCPSRYYSPRESEACRARGSRSQRRGSDLMGWSSSIPARTLDASSRARRRSIHSDSEDRDFQPAPRCLTVLFPTAGLQVVAIDIHTDPHRSSVCRQLRPSSPSISKDATDQLHGKLRRVVLPNTYDYPAGFAQ
jgi:hypothetical protein